LAILLAYEQAKDGAKGKRKERRRSERGREPFSPVVNNLSSSSKRRVKCINWDDCLGHFYKRYSGTDSYLLLILANIVASHIYERGKSL